MQTKLPVNPDLNFAIFTPCRNHNKQKHWFHQNLTYKSSRPGTQYYWRNCPVLSAGVAISFLTIDHWP